MPSKSRKVVLVDDNEVIRMALRAILRHAGFDVVGEARDGESVADLVEKARPDVVCLDVSMPGRSGLEVLGELRDRFPKVKVLMITAHSDRETVSQVVAQGAAGMVLKPFNSARVIETMNRVLGLDKPS